MLDERGGNLSGGQRQRLCLARAFLPRSSILVMDEATSALDVETERVIMDNVNTYFGDSTVLMISKLCSAPSRAWPPNPLWAANIGVWRLKKFEAR